MKDFVHGYFTTNRENLEKSYPGLKETFLNNEFKFFSKCDLEDASMAGEILESWKAFEAKLERGIPLEYINQRAFFYESSFFVDERVLIPRFETEGLLEQAMNEIDSCPRDVIKLCEVGTGPGTISLSLLRSTKSKEVQCDAIDICPQALSVAKINAFRLRPHYAHRHELNLILGDRLFENNQHYDLIVSNPPYIKEVADSSLVHEMVSKYEPHVALFLQDEEYDMWFKVFFTQVRDHLKEGGLFLMEGHEAHLEYLSELCENIFEESSVIIKDLAGASRILKIRKTHG